MKPITLCSSLDDFRRSFDAGGRWWNFGSHRDDGVVTSGEAAAAAGGLFADLDAMLTLEMQIHALPMGDRHAARGMLDAGLRDRLAAAAIQRVAPGRLEADGKEDAAVVMQGDVRPLPIAEEPGGTVPYWMGMGRGLAPGITKLWMGCRIAEVRGGDGPAALAAWPITDPEIPGGTWTLGGTVKELIPEESRRGIWKKFLFVTVAAPDLV
ncbi:MAG: hypothetical protein K8T20_00060 [Planctomycetes bacterium]|nr:hypothetical protein [Planctomycetota bacterium]